MTRVNLTLALAAWTGIQPEEKVQIPSDYEILQMLRVDCGLGIIEAWPKLLALGDRAFPAYLRILAAKDITAREVGRIFGIVVNVKADRSQFLEHAVAGLASSDDGLRRSSLHLIAGIGSSRDSAPIVALLSDKEWTVCIAAAKALAKIGDQRTLTAMNVWLNSSSPRKDRNELFDKSFREDIAKYRDELKQRLEKEK